MNHPKVKLVKALENYQLIVEFDNNQIKKYDVNPLLKKPMFSPLTNLALFKSVQVEKGGYAVVWNGDIDISEYELWQHGQTMP